MDRINSFINELSKVESRVDMTNMYAPSSPQSEVCKHNLSLYLHRMVDKKCNTILVGEAPGYRGCRLSGIPFVCEDMFTQKWVPDLMGSDLGYKIFSKGKLEHEGSASVVWPKLKEWHSRFQSMPLLWNIYPFHPHKCNNVNSNRTPSSQELKMGKEFLIKLLDLFDITNFGGIGRKAESTMKGMRFPDVSYIRHPSRGGSIVFASHIDVFMNSHVS